MDDLWTFLDSVDRETLFRLVAMIRYDGVGTLTGNALDYAAFMIFGNAEGNRANVPDLAILVTDGAAQDRPQFTVQVNF